MSGGEPTLTESPVPAALARLPGRSADRLARAQRPSVPLASLREAADEPAAPGGRRASDAAFAGRYRKVTEFDGSPPEMPRRASLAVPGDGRGPGEAGRRRSWAARLQLERQKRRKSGGNDPDETDVRHKRPSWWNVFVPDNMRSRSRRASQQLSRSAESVAHSLQRSKSRSVDHGFAPPFDLDSLRSKVDGRFDAVQRDEEEQARRLPPPPPVKTMAYTVRDRDTLTSLAARFDTTPSELTKLNRLATQFIFPGQSLLVPDKTKDGGEEAGGGAASGAAAAEPTPGASSEPAREKEMLDNLRPGSPEAPASGGGAQRFLKIGVRHITDGQGVVSGVLLVTPNALMFDPNVSDALVLEHGPESYGVIAPMEYVVNAAIFFDIAHMRPHGPAHGAPGAEPAEIYYPSPPAHSPGKDSLLVKDEPCAEPQAAGGGAADGEPEERGGAAFPEAFEGDLVTPPGQLQQRTADERRESPLDHHWAIPSKDRTSVDRTSEVSSGGRGQESCEGSAAEGVVGDGAHLVKLSYHDSGIDIRDPLLHVAPADSKKVYSDADIVLSGDWVPPVCLPRAEAPLSAPPLGESERAPRKPAAVAFSLDGQQKEDPSKPDKKNKMLKRLSYPLSWVEGLTGEGQPPGAACRADSSPTAADSQQASSVFSKVFNSSPMNLVEFGTGLFLSKTPSEEAPPDAPLGRSSLGGFGRAAAKAGAAPPPKLDYRSMVSVDDMPDLFASFDKLIPRPARPSDDPPLYLRLRMGKPAGRPLPRSTPLMSYGRKRMKPEYWFGVPRNRVDDLFKFLTHWVPDRYGPLGDVAARGFELIDSDTEVDDDDDAKPGQKESSGSSGDVSDLTRESWELLKAPYVKIYSIMRSQAEALGDSLGEEPPPQVLSMSDELRRALYSASASVDADSAPPELLGSSEIFSLQHREELCGVLPARAQGYMWSLAFSTSQHGFSLASMYRKMQGVDSPVLLLIQDTDNNVFGALTSCALRPSEHFYGTGESLLFSFREAPRSRFEAWRWTGENVYFVRGSPDSLSIGAGDGKFGLWLDGDLYLGRTQRCATYANEPLTTREDFVVKTLECWTFI